MSSMEFPIPLIEKERYPRFFFGQLKKVKGHFCVRDVVGAPGFKSRHKSEISLPSGTFAELMYKAMIDNWVVGLKGRSGPVLFEDKGVLAPVQVIPWSYFENKGVEPDAIRSLLGAIKYVRSDSDTLTLEIQTGDSLPLIGGKESVIIYDEFSNVFLKGFSYVGEGKISCANLSFLSGDDFLKVEEQNQVSPMTFGDAFRFLLLVPEKDNEYAKDKKHSVLDRRGWQSLDEYKAPVQKIGRFSSVGKDEDFVGELGVKEVPEEDQFDSRLVTTQKVNDDVHDMASTSAGETVDDVVTSSIPLTKDNPTYLFGPNVGGVIVAATQALKNEQDRTEVIKMPTDASQKNTGGTRVQSVAESASGTGSVETEVEFLTRFKKAVEDCGFHYAVQDLIRFHTCVKCGFLTVLGGAPGAGKSSLVKLYASAILGREDGKCRDGMLMVDVNSSWAEPADILGYWDLTTRYRPSTGVVPFLQDAINSNHLNLICLEEMNLARVEHYFSDFMQQSEREISERELKGVPPQKDFTLEKDKNGQVQENVSLPNVSLHIDESVRIVGTNNFDETTQRFSARFFDRCNYIELQDSRGEDDFLLSRPNIVQEKFDLAVSWGIYKSWIKTSATFKNESVMDEKGNVILEKETIQTYKAIRNALNALNLKPSPRVESLLVEYAVNRPFVEGFESDCDKQLRILDEFVAQRILPRYTPSYLKDDSKEREALKNILRSGKKPEDDKMPKGDKKPEDDKMPLSLKIIKDKESELEGLPR